MVVSAGSMGGDDRQLLRQAHQGSQEALERLLNQTLNPEGFGARVHKDQDRGLVVWLEGLTVPPQKRMVDYVQQVFTHLAIPDVERVLVIGGNPGGPSNDYVWQEALAIKPIAPSPVVQPDAAVPPTLFEMGGEFAGNPKIAYADKILMPTEHGVLVFAGVESGELGQARSTPQASQFCQPAMDSVGLDGSIQDAIAALQDARPVLVYGDVGMGKTTLLRALAHHPTLAQACPDGIVYHSGQTQPLADLLDSLYDAFFVSTSTPPRKPTPDEIQRLFQAKQALVVLDNVALNPDDLNSLLHRLRSLQFVIASPNYANVQDALPLALRGMSQEDGLQLITQCLGRELNSEESTLATTLCQRLNRVPLRIRQAIALVGEDHSLSDLAQRLGSSGALETLVLRSCANLSETERRVLAALGVIGAMPVPTHHIAALTGTGSSQSVLESLSHRGLLTTDGYRYALADNLVEPLQTHWNLSPWVQPVINYFLGWIHKNAQSPDLLAQESNLLAGVMERALAHKHWSPVLQAARALDQAFVLNGQWDRWQRIWQLALQAGEGLGDQEAIAYASHQLGTRALCRINPRTAQADPLAATTYLTRAWQLRQGLGHHEAAKASYHNLRWLQSPDWQASGNGYSPGLHAAPQAQPHPLHADPNASSAPPSLVNAEPAQRGLPAAAQVGLVAALFLGLGSFLAYQLTQNRPSVSLSPNRLVFESQTANQQSPPQRLTLENTGSGLLELVPFTFSGDHPSDFRVATTNCGEQPLFPDDQCQVDITFAPQGGGTRSAVLLVRDRNRRINERIPLQGSSPDTSSPTNPTNPGGPITLSFQPGNLDFGEVAINDSSPSLSIALRNESSQPVTIQGISVLGQANSDFSVTQQCTGGPLAPGQSCPISVTFRPTLAGARSANLSVSDTANNLWNVPLRGTGITVTTGPQEPSLSLSPSRLSFGDVELSQASRENTVTISNQGNQTLIVSSVNIEGDNAFTIRRNSCTREPLQPNASCSIGVVFSPLAQGNRSGTLQISSNDPRGAARVLLTGNGVQPGVTEVRATPTQLGFGQVELENASPPQTVTLQNTGNTPVNLGTIEVRGNQDFISNTDRPVGANCSNRNLRPGEVCRFEVVFLPFVEGDRAAQLTIPTNSPQGTLTIPLQGRGIVQQLPILSVRPGSLSFSAQPVGGSSPPQFLTLENRGSATLTLGNLTIDGSHPNDFAASPDNTFNRIQCSGVTLRPGETCSLEVFFNPIADGDRRAILRIPSNDRNGQFGVNLNGIGTRNSPIPLPGIPFSR